MATESQINANRENAQSSTGPRTPEGKAASSRNRLSVGLFTRHDYVKPEERDFYKEFSEEMYGDLLPITHLEESFVGEIIGASWRLRRCAAAEAQLEAWDDTTEKTRRSIDRARAAALNVLTKSINHLRKLQTERVTRDRLNLPDKFTDPLAETDKIAHAVRIHNRNGKCQPAPAPAPESSVAMRAEAALAKIMNQTPDWAAVDRVIAAENEAAAKKAAEKNNPPAQSASNCKTPPNLDAIEAMLHSLCPDLDAEIENERLEQAQNSPSRYPQAA